MKKILFLTIALSLLFTGCSKNDNIPEQKESITTIVGNTYAAKHYLASNNNQIIYYIYQFKSNGDITIYERYNTVNGDLRNELIGSYQYNHPNLKLKIQSVANCNDCFNNFDATVNNNFESFIYTIFDISKGKNVELIFQRQ